jgi:hypothetical protein
MAGPPISDPKKVKPDSPISTPNTANMATRPCFNSLSLYLIIYILIILLEDKIQIYVHGCVQKYRCMEFKDFYICTYT